MSAQAVGPTTASRATPVSSRSGRAAGGEDEAGAGAEVAPASMPWTAPELGLAWQQALAQRAQGLATAAPAAGGVLAPASVTVSALQAAGAAQAAGDAQAGLVAGGTPPRPAWEVQFTTAPGQAWQLRVELAPAPAPLQPAALLVAVACSAVPALLGGAQLPALAQRMRAKGLSVGELAWQERQAPHQRSTDSDSEAAR